MELHIIFSTYF